MSRVRMLDAGRFNRQLSGENPVETADGSGGFYKTYQATDAVWAHVCPVSADAKLRANTQETDITHKVILRFRSGVGPTSRFVTGTRRFHVDTVRDPDETGRYLECLVVERS